MIFLPLATTSDPITILVDLLFLAGIASFMSWFYIYRLQKEIIGGFIAGVVLAGIGSILLVSIFQNLFRNIIMWLMSPKIGTFQLSNLNLILVFISAFLTLYLVSILQNRKIKK